MAFNRLYKQIEKLIQTNEEIDSSIPCKTDILDLRECRKGGKSCDDLGLELLRCMAQYKVDTTEKLRETIGVAKYNEYVKMMEDKHGKDKATEIITEPTEQLKDIEAYQVLYRVTNSLHPKGPPKTESDLKNWTYADQVRLEMGEREWWDSVKLIGYEFGLETTDRLFGLSKESELIISAQERLIPEMKGKKDAAVANVRKIEESVKKEAIGGDYAAAFKTLYPTQTDLEAALK